MHPQRVLWALWPLEPRLGLWRPSALRRAAYTIGLVGCATPSTWWDCEHYETQRWMALQALQRLPATLKQELSHGALLEIFAGRRLRAVEVVGAVTSTGPAGNERALPPSSSPSLPWSANDGGGEGDDHGDDAAWCDLPTPLLIPLPDTAVLGRFVPGAPVTLWVADLIQKV